MPIGLALGLLASLAWGVVDVTGALAGRRVGSVRVLAGAQVASLVVLAAIVVADPSRLGSRGMDGFLAGLLPGVIAALAYLSYFTALRIGPLSVVSPVILAYGGATVVLAVLLRGESLLPAQAAGAALATVGVVLAGVVFDERSLRGARLVGPGVAVAVVTIVLFAVATVALAGPIQTYGWLAAGLGSRSANATMALLILLLVAGRSRARRGVAPVAVIDEPMAVVAAVGPGGAPAVIPADMVHRDHPRYGDRMVIALVVATGLFDVLGFLSFAVGLEVAPTWLVGLASSFGPVIAIVFAVRRLGERLRTTQWLGLALLAVGVVLLAVAG